MAKQMKWGGLALAALMVMNAGDLSAEGPEEIDKRTEVSDKLPLRLGIGVSFSPGDAIAQLFLGEGTVEEFPLGSVGLSQIHVPIHIADILRVEPEFGLLKFSESDSDGPWTADVTGRKVGFTLSAMVHSSRASATYLGVAGGSIKFSEEYVSENYERSSRRTDKYMGLVAGGEHFLSPRASIGAEARLSRITQGDETSSYENDPQPSPTPYPYYLAREEETDTTHDASALFTDLMLFIRFYF